MNGLQVPSIFSPSRRRLRDLRAAYRQQAEAPARWLHNAMAEDVLERLAFLKFVPARAWVAGDQDGRIAAALAAKGAEVCSPPGFAIDEEHPLEGGPYDLVVSLFRLDSVNDLPGALLHIRKALAVEGMMIATLIGAGSLPALRHAMLAADGERPAPRIHPQVDSRSATALLQRAGFSRQVVDSHSLAVRYSCFGSLISDLRDQGLTAILHRRGPPLGKVGIARARAAFGESADEDGKTTECFEILTLTGWR